MMYAINDHTLIVAQSPVQTMHALAIMVCKTRAERCGSNSKEQKILNPDVILAVLQ
jgi:hypothetical protein